MTMPDPQRVLVLGNPDEGVAPPSVLSGESGFEVETACSHDEAYDRLSQNNIDCVLTSVEGARTRTMDAIADHPDVSVCIVIKAGPQPVVLELDPIRTGGQLANGGQLTTMPGKRTMLSHQIEAAVTSEQEALNRSTPDPEKIYERISDGFFAVNRVWEYTHVNSEAAALTGRSQTELIGTSVWDAFPELVDSPFEDALRRAMESGETTTVEAHYPAHGIWYDVCAYPDDEGISIYFRDVTERIARREKLERENERLEKFVSIVSHDLRNPLNVIRGALDLIEETGDTAHTDLGLRGVGRMEDLITDLLQLAKQGRKVEATEQVILADVCTQCWETVDTQSAVLEVEDGDTILANKNRLKQLLENLFGNAVEHGGDEVIVTVEPLVDAAGFYVADTGPGIPESDREKVLEHGYSTSNTGTGFGLSIVSEIVTAHGWQITVCESESGGTRFEISGVSTVES